MGGGWHINSRCGHKIYDDCERGISTAAIDKVGKAQNGVATFVRLWPLNSALESLKLESTWSGHLPRFAGQQFTVGI